MCCRPQQHVGGRQRALRTFQQQRIGLQEEQQLRRKTAASPLEGLILKRGNAWPYTWTVRAVRLAPPLLLYYAAEGSARSMWWRSSPSGSAAPARPPRGSLRLSSRSLVLHPPFPLDCLGRQAAFFVAVIADAATTPLCCPSCCSGVPKRREGGCLCTNMALLLNAEEQDPLLHRLSKPRSAGVGTGDLNSSSCCCCCHDLAEVPPQTLTAASLAREESSTLKNLPALWRAGGPRAPRRACVSGRVSPSLSCATGEPLEDSGAVSKAGARPLELRRPAALSGVLLDLEGDWHAESQAAATAALEDEAALRADGWLGEIPRNLTRQARGEPQRIELLGGAIEAVRQGIRRHKEQQQQQEWGLLPITADRELVQALVDVQHALVPEENYAASAPHPPTPSSAPGATAAAPPVRATPEAPSTAAMEAAAQDAVFAAAASASALAVSNTSCRNTTAPAGRQVTGTVDEAAAPTNAALAPTTAPAGVAASDEAPLPDASIRTDSSATDGREDVAHIGAAVLNSLPATRTPAAADTCAAAGEASAAAVDGEADTAEGTADTAPASKPPLTGAIGRDLPQGKQDSSVSKHSSKSLTTPHYSKGAREVWRTESADEELLHPVSRATPSPGCSSLLTESEVTSELEQQHEEKQLLQSLVLELLERPVVAMEWQAGRGETAQCYRDAHATHPKQILRSVTGRFGVTNAIVGEAAGEGGQGAADQGCTVGKAWTGTRAALLP
ncbi:hypothetical protein cyc_00737 [Cyclospora cayetanensis]|uniref:Uncharacterized protein n=1 Tax=Cyclospora cayetanensis TaxID=88456 RepID=A0A1D3D477_9EIME|nr:hypothetical protein cyc_00737 [Cyclospora cayetanensis]